MKEVFEGDETTKGEIWFDRKLGIRAQSLGQVTVDDGKISHCWSTVADKTTVLVRPSMDGVAMVAEMCDVSRIPDNWRKNHGRFMISIPTAGKAAGAAYPTEFAPRFIDIDDQSGQGKIVLREGVSMKGRVVDRSRNGVADTVAGIPNTEMRQLFMFFIPIGTAVKTDAWSTWTRRIRKSC